MEDKITIIEGPTPTFEIIPEGWVLGLTETPSLTDVAITRLRTFNGPELVERCHRAWRHNETIHLEYRGEDGLEQRAPIVAARYVEAEEAHLLLLWVRLVNEGVEIELDLDDSNLEDDYEDDEYDVYDDFDIEFDDEDESDYDDEGEDDFGRPVL